MAQQLLDIPLETEMAARPLNKLFVDNDTRFQIEVFICANGYKQLLGMMNGGDNDWFDLRMYNVPTDKHVWCRVRTAGSPADPFDKKAGKSKELFFVEDENFFAKFRLRVGSSGVKFNYKGHEPW